MAKLGPAVSTAATGATIGSAFGPIGTGVGAGVGFLGGLLEEEEKKIRRVKHQLNFLSKENIS